jgi:hypothetical protein
VEWTQKIKENEALFKLGKTKICFKILSSKNVNGLKRRVKQKKVTCVAFINLIYFDFFKFNVASQGCFETYNSHKANAD